MGFYVSPSDISKETWLEMYAKEVTFDEVRRGVMDSAYGHKNGFMFLCYVINPLFTAVSIIVDTTEYYRFTQPDDCRDKIWFKAPTKALEPFIPKSRNWREEFL